MEAQSVKVSIAAFWFLGILALVITVLAFTTDPAVASREFPATTTDQSGVSEQRLSLHDGRTVLCLVFASPVAVSCDWDKAFAP